MNMIYIVKKFCFFNLIISICIVTFLLLRLHNSGLLYWHFREKKSLEKNLIREDMKTSTQSPPPLKIPWRFQIEEDGFVFPPEPNEEKFITYEMINDTWTKQILQFENANIFAYLLKRTLIVPPLIPFIKYVGDNDVDIRKPKHAISNIIDFDLLASMVKLAEINSSQIEKIKTMPKYSVCHDPRLGFWLDYIPSVENIQTWRVLKEQHFTPFKLNVQGAREEYGCPATKQYMERWGPPLRVKALYRGILTELSERDEELIYFESPTLDTRNIRFFDKQRARKAQEILLFFIRFSKDITKQTKKLAAILNFGYIAVLANHIDSTDGMVTYIANEAERIGNPKRSKTLFIVCNATQTETFTELEAYNFTLYFAHNFIKDNLIEGDLLTPDQIHLLSLLLCAYAAHFIGFPGTSDLYYVEHLRLQDVSMVDGLVTDKVSVRWARHTMRDRADEKKILQKTTTKILNEAKIEQVANKTFNIKNLKQNIGMQPKTLVNVKVARRINTVKRTGKRKPDRLSSIACTFCNYIRHVTGNHGCPNMKRLC